MYYLSGYCCWGLTAFLLAAQTYKLTLASISQTVVSEVAKHCFKTLSEGLYLGFESTVQANPGAVSLLGLMLVKLRVQVLASELVKYSCPETNVGLRSAIFHNAVAPHNKHRLGKLHPQIKAQRPVCVGGGFPVTPTLCLHLTWGACLESGTERSCLYSSVGEWAFQDNQL